MIEWIQTAIVYIDHGVTGSEAHDSHKASQGGGNLWIDPLIALSLSMSEMYWLLSVFKENFKEYDQEKPSKMSRL